MADIFRNKQQLQIDKIVPVSVFDHAKPWEKLSCWFYSNSQLLFKDYNLAKGSKYIEEDKRALMKEVKKFYLASKEKGKEIVNALHITVVNNVINLKEVVCKKMHNNKIISYIL